MVKVICLVQISKKRTYATVIIYLLQTLVSTCFLAFVFVLFDYS